MQPRTFRRIPTNIDAMQFDGSVESASAIIDWVLATPSVDPNVPNLASWRCVDPGGPGGECSHDDEHQLIVRTMDGYDAPVQPNWWVTRGVRGEFYQIAPEILEETYKPVDNATQQAVDDTVFDVLRGIKAQLESFGGRCMAAIREELERPAPSWGEVLADEPAEVEDGDGAPFPGEIQRTRRFFLTRTDDVTGVHADGLIAIGVWFGGPVVLNWLPGRNVESGSFAVWPDLDDMVATHLHPRSNTRLVWVD